MEIGDLGVDEHEEVSRSSTTSEEEMELRRGPWTVEEDLILMNYINCHGEGRWNSLARCAGLKRTGKSCRLRWLNYLRPDVRRGNITPEEQLLILELHSRWGNRWSKIALHLPGRTDNEIKNYWRTRVQKHAKQMKCDVNSKQFKDVMRYIWMPRLLERIRAAKSSDGSAYPYPDPTTLAGGCQTAAEGSGFGQVNLNQSSESSCGAASSLDSSSVGTHIESPVMVTAGCTEGGEVGPVKGNDAIQTGQSQWDPYLSETLPSPAGYSHLGLLDSDWWSVGDLSENLWSIEDNWLIQQQQNW